MTSAAAREPRRPHSASGRPAARPASTPAAYWSPAPVVSTTASTGSAAMGIDRVARDQGRALRPVGDGGDLHTAADGVLGGVECRRSRRGRRSPISLANRMSTWVSMKPSRACAVALDHEGVGEAEGDAPAVGARQAGRLGEGLARRGRVEQIALEVEDGGGLDDRRVDVGGTELHAGAQIGAHRPLAVGRDIDQAAARWTARRPGAPWRSARRWRGCRGRRCARARRRRPCPYRRRARPGPRRRPGCWRPSRLRPPGQAPCARRAPPREPRRSGSSSPGARPSAWRKPGSAEAMTSTMALPIAAMSRAAVIPDPCSWRDGRTYTKPFGVTRPRARAWRQSGSVICSNLYELLVMP